MANRFAVASGNFNDTATWSTTAAGSPGASVPVAGDNAIANNRTVTITANATCDNLTNGTTYGGTAGGSFVLQNGVTLAATTISATSSVSVVQFSQASPASATLTISETLPSGSNAVVTNSNTGTLNINASIFRNNASGSSAVGILNSGAGIVNFTGLLSQTSGASSPVINNSSVGTINVNGTNVGRAISNLSTGTIIWNGELTALNETHAITSTTAGSTVRASGNFIFSANGTVPIYAPKFILGTTPTAAKTQYALNGTGTYVNMFTADNTGLGPAVGDVRAGTVYGSATGTLAVPLPSQVAVGVATDNTVGTALVTGADIATAVWGAATRSITGGTVDTLTNAPASVTPSDIWSHATRTITGGTVDTATTLTNAPTVPSVVQIRAEMDSNSTKLANLDATVSSRLASSAYSAAPTTAQIATAVEGSLLNEADGQTVLAAIVGAIGNTNLSEVSLVAAVRADLERNGGKLDNIPTTAAPSASAVASATRTELSTELSRIDQSISSRLAASSYTAPANSDISAIKSKTDNLPASPAATGDIPSANIAAIKAKTDLLNTDRLANVATTNIVGTLLAQANS